jgi:hypothetical protein
MTPLPILDIGPYLAGEDGARENIGFSFMINHGIPQELIDSALNEAARVEAA